MDTQHRCDDNCLRRGCDFATSGTDSTAALLAEAARLGAAAGQMAGTWCYDGNTPP